MTFRPAWQTPSLVLAIYETHYESLIAVVDPRLIRAAQRTQAGKFSINGVEMESIAKVVANGKKLAEYRAQLTVDAITKAMANWKPTQP